MDTRTHALRVEAVATEEKERSLSHSAAKGAAWNLAGSTTRFVLGFVVSALLARILGPKPFGLVAVVTLLLGFVNLLVESGLTAGLIQKNRISDLEIRSVFTQQMTVSAAIFGALYVGAPSVARFFGDNQLVQVVRALSLVLILQAGSQTATALLRRKLDFGYIQRAQIASYLLGYVLIGIPAALSGFGVWSLVAAQLSQAALYTVQVLLKTRHSVRLHLSRDLTLLRFGSKVLGTNLLNWGSSSLDQVIAGKYFGLVNLGLYNRNVSLVSIPNGIIVGSVQSVLLSFSSRHQEDREYLGRTYLGLLQVVTLFTFPLFFSLVALPKVAVVGVLGSMWLDAAPLLPPLALAAASSSIGALPGPILVGMGFPNVELRQSAIGSIIALCLLILAGQLSIVALAWAVLLIRLAYLVLLTYPLLRFLRLVWSTVIRALGISAVLGTLVALCTFSCVRGFSLVFQPSPEAQLGLATLTGCAVLVFLLRFSWNRVLPIEAKRVVNAFPFPGPVRIILTRMGFKLA